MRKGSEGQIFTPSHIFSACALLVQLLLQNVVVLLLSQTVRPAGVEGCSELNLVRLLDALLCEPFAQIPVHAHEAVQPLARRHPVAAHGRLFLV